MYFLCFCILIVTYVLFCIFCFIVSFCVLFVCKFVLYCTVLLPPGVNPIAVKKICHFLFSSDFGDVTLLGTCKSILLTFTLYIFRENKLR